MILRTSIKANLKVIMCCVCVFIALPCLFYVQTRTGSVSFPDVAEAAFGSMGRWFAGMLAYVDLFALTVGSMLLASCSFEVMII